MNLLWYLDEKLLLYKNKKLMNIFGKLELYDFNNQYGWDIHEFLTPVHMKLLSFMIEHISKIVNRSIWCPTTWKIVAKNVENKNKNKADKAKEIKDEAYVLSNIRTSIPYHIYILLTHYSLRTDNNGLHYSMAALLYSIFHFYFYPFL